MRITNIQDPAGVMIDKKETGDCYLVSKYTVKMFSHGSNSSLL